MNRTATLLMTVVLLVATVSALPMAAAAQSDAGTAAIGQTNAQVDENASENASDVAPGERLTGVIGVGQAEFEGEIELRSYGIEVARSATADAKADVVKERLNATEQRLNELEQQRQELEEARENGSMGEGEYRARVTELSARTETVKQMADASEAHAGELPADLLESKGINVTAIQLLKQNAGELSGGQVAEIARSIAGDDVGQSVSQGPPEEIGAPSPDDRGADDGDAGEAGDAGDAQAAIDRAEEQVNATQQRLEEVDDRLGENASENATDALEQAYAELEQAKQALEDARVAMESGDDEAAASHVEDALSHAEQANEHAQDALEAAQDAPDDGQGDGPDAGSTDGTSGSGQG